MKHFAHRFLAHTSIVLAVAGFLLGCSTPVKRETPPNVVFIMSDDIGLGDIAFYHRERTGDKEIIPTPNLDRLIERGVRFDDAHTSAALCAPTRYSVMTGNYSFRCHKPWGVWGAFEPSAIQKGQATVAEVMKSAGYKTGFFGKWHLGGDWYKKGSKEIYTGNAFGSDEVDFSRIIDAYPNKLGFDYSCQLPAGIQNSPYMFYENGVWMPLEKDSEIKIEKDSRGKKTKSNRAQGADSHWEASKAGPVLAKKTISFIKKHHSSNPEKPFFIYYCSQAVHVPHNPPVTFDGKKVKGKTLSDHGDMIYELDLQVGAIVKTLSELDILDKTIIIFTSDNGGLDMESTESTGHDSSNGFRESKGSIYEGGHRVPFFVSWPNGQRKKGVVSNEQIMTHDLMATMYALTGQTKPDNQGIDSYNILPLICSEKGAKGREVMMIQSAGGNPYLAIRKGDWKLIMKTDKSDSKREPVALFNIRTNPYEDESENYIAKPEMQNKVKNLLATYNTIRDKN